MEPDVDNGRSARAAAALLGLVLAFAACARGGRELWAATPVYLAVLALAAFVFALRAWPKDAPGCRLTLALPAAALALALTASLPGAVNPEASRCALFDWLAAIAAFLTAVNVFQGERALEAFVRCAAPMVAVELAVGLWQKVHAAPGLSSVWRPLLIFQPNGTLGNSNTSTAFVLPWLPVLAVRARGAAGAARRWWTALLACACADLLMFSSHWGWLCAAASLPFWPRPDALARMSPRQRRRLAAAGAAVAAVFALILWRKFTRTVDIAGNPIPPGRGLSRLLWWASALKMFADHPLAGLGLGGFGSAYVSYKVGFGQHSLFAHSLPLELLAETGLLGLGAFCAFAACWARAAKSRERWPFALGAALLLAYCLLSVGLEFPANLLLLWLFFAAALPKARRLAWKPRRAVVLVAAAAALAAVPELAAPLVSARVTAAGQQLLSAGDYRDALTRFADAAQAFPLSSEAERGWARALFARYAAERQPGDLEGALAHQLRAIALDRRDAPLWAELAAYRLARGDEGGAQAAAARAKALRPNPSLY